MIGAENAPDGASPRAKTIARSDALRVAVASLVSAGSGYFVLAFAARVLLPVENNTVFVTFWSTLFACFGVLSGLSIETTRAVTVATSAPSGERDDRHPRVLTVGVTVGVLAGLASLGVAAYAGHSVVVGSLAGRRSWATYSHLIASEATVRLCLVLASGVVGTTLLGVAAGTAMAAFTWVAFLAAAPQARRAAVARADSTLPTFLRRIAAASVGPRGPSGPRAVDRSDRGNRSAPDRAPARSRRRADRCAGELTGVRGEGLSVMEPSSPVLRKSAAKTPRISVCMATYNGAPYVGEQMNSILEQLGPSDEVVVVDDASTDDTVDRLHAIGDQRVRVLESAENRGYVRGFEESLRNAHGQFILLSDQDDVWEPGRVRAIVGALE